LHTIIILILTAMNSKQGSILSEDKNLKTSHQPAKLQIWQHFHIRLTGLYAGAVLLTMVVLGIFFYRTGVRIETDALERRLLTTAVTIATSIDAEKISSVPIDSKAQSPLHRELFGYFTRVAAADPDIESIYLLRSTAEPSKFRFLVDFSKDGDRGSPGELYDAKNLPVLIRGAQSPSVEEKPHTDRFGTTLSGYAPIHNANGDGIGLVGVDVKVSQLAAITHNVLFAAVAIFGAAIGLLVIASILGARNVQRPIALITGAMSDVARGKLDVRLNLKRDDEFGLMSHYFDRMAEGLQERDFIRDTFGRYVSEDVAHTLLERREPVKLGGEERIVTVLFSDLRGYSTLSEHLSPTQVVNMLNNYLGAMGELIEAHDGCILEFLGDAILAVFGAPYPSPNHSAQAVNCALAMRKRLNALNAEWKDAGFARYLHLSRLDKLAARTGIHTGRVVAGNLGSPKRMKYTVIGDVVNVAERIEQLNKALETDILLSADSYAELPEDLRKIMINKGEHPVKGRERPVTVYTPKAGA